MTDPFVLLMAAVETPVVAVEVVKQASDAVVLAAIAAGGTLLTTIVTGVVAIIMRRVENQGRVASVERAVVKQKLEEATTVTVEKLNAIHVLVNGGMGEQLKINADLAKRIADSTHTPADVEAARVAHEAYAAHMAKLAIDATGEALDAAQPPVKKP